VLAFHEARLGHDLSHVRIHRDGEADQAARSIGATAFTFGSHVVFGRGSYAPHGESGQRLLGHELAHVVQQPRSPGPPLRIGAPDSPAERAAGADGEAAEAASHTVDAGTVQRQVAAGGPGEPEPEPQSSGAPVPGKDGTNLLAEDDAQALRPGQARKSEFLAQLRNEICAVGDQVLASVGQSTDGCPYLDRWFAHVAGKSSGYVEQVIARYAPETAGVTRAGDYIPRIVARVRQGMERWVRTGELGDVPEGLPSPGGPENTPEVGTAEAGTAESTPSGGGAVQFKARDGGAGSTDPRSVRSQLRPGTPLDASTRGRMEAAFGHDFSRVRLHTDPAAASLSARLNAHAFTVGNDVAFASGAYQPDTVLGDTLLAHELAHVVQQEQTPGVPAGGPAPGTLEEDADESAAAAVAAALRGGTLGSLRDLARNAKPRLRSGLALTRCAVVTGGGISPSAFNFEQVTGGGDPNDRALPWYAACVNITIAHFGTAGRMQICQFEVGFPGIHRLGRTSIGQAQTEAAAAFDAVVPAQLRRRSASCATIASGVQRLMGAAIPGVRVNSPCLTRMLTPTDWPTRH
jgi:Domain of unknown function (DUF4157)